MLGRNYMADGSQLPPGPILLATRKEEAPVPDPSIDLLAGQRSYCSRLAILSRRIPRSRPATRASGYGIPDRHNCCVLPASAISQRVGPAETLCQLGDRPFDTHALLGSSVSLGPQQFPRQSLGLTGSDEHEIHRC